MKHLYPRFQAFIRSLPARLTGSRVDLYPEGATYLSTRAAIPADTRLEQRLKEARSIPKPDVERKTPESAFLRRLRTAMQDDLIGERRGPIEVERTGPKRAPIDYDREGLPNG